LQDLLYLKPHTVALSRIINNAGFLKEEDDLISKLLRVYARDNQAIQDVLEMKGKLVGQCSNNRDYRLRWLT